MALAASAGQLRLNAMEPGHRFEYPAVDAHADKGHGDLEGTLLRWYRSRRGSDVARPIRCSRHAVGVARRIQQSIQSFQKKALVEKRNLRDVVEEENVLTEAQNKQILGDAAEFADVSNNTCG